MGAGVRNSERLDYIPARLSLVPRLFARTCIPDVVLIHVAPPRDGRVSLGVEVNVLLDAVLAIEDQRFHEHHGLDVWRIAGSMWANVRSGEPVVDDGLFGLLPNFAAEVGYGRRTYNARSETVHRLPSFRDAWARGQRCIIPAEAIYEPNWETGQCVRWAISQEGQVPFGIAGLYTDWLEPKTLKRVWSFAMLTVNADRHPLLKRFHKPEDEKRMVVILHPSDYADWLSCPVAEAKRFFRCWEGPLRAVGCARALVDHAVEMEEVAAIARRQERAAGAHQPDGLVAQPRVVSLVCRLRRRGPPSATWSSG